MAEVVQIIGHVLLVSHCLRKYEKQCNGTSFSFINFLSCPLWTKIQCLGPGAVIDRDCLPAYSVHLHNVCALELLGQLLVLNTIFYMGSEICPQGKKWTWIENNKFMRSKDRSINFFLVTIVNIQRLFLIIFLTALSSWFCKIYFVIFLTIFLSCF